MRAPRFVLLSVLIALVMVLVLAGCAGQAPTTQAPTTQAPTQTTPSPTKTAEVKVVEWHWHSLLTTTNPEVIALTKLASEAWERSGHTLKIIIHPNSELGYTGADMLDIVSKGLVQASSTAGSHVAGQEQVLTVTELPMLFGAEGEGPLVFEVATPFWEKAWDKHNQVFLGAYTTGGTNSGNIIWARKPVAKFEDFKGLKMRGVPITAKLIERLGGSAMTTPYAELLTALSQGVIDATTGGLTTGIAGKYYEVAPHVTLAVVNAVSMQWVVNKDAFNALSAQNQKMLRDLAKELLPDVWKGNTYTPDKVKWLEDNGCTIHYMSEADTAKIRVEARVVWDEWAKTAGPEAQQALNAIMSSLETFRAGKK